MNIQKLYKAANNEICTGKEKALEEIFKKADTASSVPKKAGVYHLPVTVAASLAAILICYSAVNRFILPPDDKNTALKSDLTESIIDEKEQSDEKEHAVSEKSESVETAGDKDKINTTKEDKGMPAVNNAKTENVQTAVKEEKTEPEKTVSENTEADTAEEGSRADDKAGEEALTFAASAPVEQETEKNISSDSLKEEAAPENTDEYDGGTVYEEKSISASGASRSAQGKNSAVMSKGAELPLDVTVSCVSVNGDVITVNDPIYGTVSGDIKSAVLLKADGEKAELSDIKSGADLKITYVSRPSGGKAEICKIIID